MKPAMMLPATDISRILDWAVRRREPIALTLRRDAGWVLARCQFVSMDAAHANLLVTYPIPNAGDAIIEIVPGERVGGSFRRGHKKCVFNTNIVGRQSGESEPPAVVLAVPTQMREIQRRAYQRVAVPADRPMEARLWEQGFAAASREEVPPLLCSGLVHDLSVGGLQIVIDGHDDPRLGAGERVGIELRLDRTAAPLLLDGAFRHAMALPSGRIGLGLQFVGLEMAGRGQNAMQTLISLVSEFRRVSARSLMAEELED